MRASQLDTEPKASSVAAIVFTYNENINLPLWLKHYGSQFGEEHLYIADRGSNDGSIDNIGKANLIRLPRNEFDEFEKTEFINSMHAALLNFYDAVIYTDCDEFLVPDPDKYSDLRHYIAEMPGDFVRAVGVDVLHVLNKEFPIDLTRPILSQRRFGKFGSASCKALISKVPLRWLPGFHSCNQKVPVDPELTMFHLKFMDYNIAMQRQLINIDTVWSERSLKQNFGQHHRWDIHTFVHNGFFVPTDVANRNAYGAFEFSAEIAAFESRSELANGYWYIPMDIHKFVTIPDRFGVSL